MMGMPCAILRAFSTAVFSENSAAGYSGGSTGVGKGAPQPFRHSAPVEALTIIEPQPGHAGASVSVAHEGLAGRIGDCLLDAVVDGQPELHRAGDFAIGAGAMAGDA